jgi:hypothetical protein
MKTIFLAAALALASTCLPSHTGNHANKHVRESL